MATRLRKGLVILMLLVILMGATKPAISKRNHLRIKKLINRLKNLEATMEEALACNQCSSIEQINALLAKTEEEVEKLKNPPTTQAPPPPTKGSCTAIGVAVNQNLISDDQMTASSVYSGYNAYKGRLYGDEGWCQSYKDTTHEYLQVDMGTVRLVCQVATQGKRNGAWVTSYKLSFSPNGFNWKTYREHGMDKVFQANRDLNTVVKHVLKNEAQARYVRFYPQSYDRYPCMRVEVYVR